MPHITSHTKILPDGREIDVFKLQSILVDRKILSVNLSNIRIPSRSKRDGFSDRRFEESDISYPIIIDEENNIIDGRHRFFKILNSGMESVKVLVATSEDIEKSLIK